MNSVNKRAFTLIELLVVIAIIAILAAILFPVFAQAKLAAKKSADLSNVKQLMLATLMYDNDYDDTGPKAENWAYSDTQDLVPAAVQYFDPGTAIFPYVKSAGLFFNPQNGYSVPGYAYNDLYGATSTSAFNNPAAMIVFGDIPFPFNGSGNYCAQDGVPLNSYKFTGQSTPPFIVEGDASWEVPTPPCLSWNPGSNVFPVTATFPYTQTGNIVSEITTLNTSTDAFNYNMVVQPYSKTWSAYNAAPLVVYGSPAVSSGSGTGATLTSTYEEDLRWSLIALPLLGGAALGGATPTLPTTPYFEIWGSGAPANYAFADGHAKAIQVASVANTATGASGFPANAGGYSNATWDPGDNLAGF